jgi:thiosulfate/3-mercaptopyruvate sulfurtransferase
MAQHLLPIVIEPEQLQPLLNDPRLLLVDLSEPPNYQRHHLPGAVNLPFHTIIRAEPPAMGLLPDAAQLSAVLSAIGLTPDRHVVAYDSEGNGRASRLLWTLDTLGHSAFSLLDGGLAAWAAANGALESGAVTPTPSSYQARFLNPDAVADLDYIRSRLADPDMVVLDTRSAGEYSGADQRAARAGHIPGAVNLDWTSLMDPQRERRMLPEAVIRGLLEQRGVTPDKEIVLHCQTHHRSAHTYVLLKHLGYPHLRGYAGSWSEWGNREDTPVER